MLQGFIKKGFYSLLVLFGVVTLVFMLFNLQQGDPARMIAGQRADKKAIDNINNRLGLNKPLIVRYGNYINNLLPISLDSKEFQHKIPLVGGVVLKWPYLNQSFQNNQPVSTILQTYFPSTFLLALFAIAIAIVLGIFFGLLSGIYKNSITDKCLLLIAALGNSGPSFFVGIIIAWVFGYLLFDYTGLNTNGSVYFIDVFEGITLALKNILLPAIALGIRPMAVVTQLTRSSVIEVVSQDFVRTARAKGLNPFKTFSVHVLKNALNPVLTSVSGWFASMLAGTVFIEYIFGWKGIGYILVDALNKYDLPVIMGVVLVTSSIFIVVNFLNDFLQTLLDPRLKKANGN